MKVHNRKIQGSLQIIIKTARALNQILPWTIAIFTGGQLIVSLQPYLTVFLSARVVDLLSVHAKMEQVIALIVLSGAGTYTLIFLGKYFDSKRNVRGLDLYWAILWRMNRVLMKCPYSEVEKTKLRTQQEEIIQAYRMSGYGPWKIPEIMMELISGCVMIVMSIVMGGVVFLPVQGERVPWATVVMLALTIVSVIVSVVSQRQLLLLNQQSIGDMGKIFMKENYLLSYMDEQKAAKDIRIYQQQNEIIGQLASAFGVFHTFIFQRGKKEARNLALRSCFAQLLTVASYVIVCIRAVNGVYSIGAVVQYVAHGGVFAVQVADEVLRALGQGEHGPQLYELGADGRLVWVFFAEQFEVFACKCTHIMYLRSLYGNLIIPNRSLQPPDCVRPHCVWRPASGRRHSAAPRRGDGNDKGKSLCKTIMQGRGPLQTLLPPHFFWLRQKKRETG